MHLDATEVNEYLLRHDEAIMVDVFGTPMAVWADLSAHDPPYYEFGTAFSSRDNATRCSRAYFVDYDTDDDYVGAVLALNLALDGADSVFQDTNAYDASEQSDSGLETSVYAMGGPLEEPFGAAEDAVSDPDLLHEVGEIGPDSVAVPVAGTAVDVHYTTDEWFDNQMRFVMSVNPFDTGFPHTGHYIGEVESHHPLVRGALSRQLVKAVRSPFRQTASGEVPDHPRDRENRGAVELDHLHEQGLSDVLDRMVFYTPE